MLLSSYLGLMLQPQNVKLTNQPIRTEPGRPHRSMDDDEFQGASFVEKAWPCPTIRDLQAKFTRPSYYTSSKFNCPHIIFYPLQPSIHTGNNTSLVKLNSDNLKPLSSEIFSFIQQLPTYMFLFLQREDRSDLVPATLKRLLGKLLINLL